SLPFCEGQKGSIDLARRARALDVDRLSDPLCRFLQFSLLKICLGIVRVYDRTNSSRFGNEFVKKLQSLGYERREDKGYTGNIATRAVETCNEPCCDRIPAGDKHNRNCRGGRRGCDRRCAAPRGNDYSWAPMN